MYQIRPGKRKSEVPALIIQKNLVTVIKIYSSFQTLPAAHYWIVIFPVLYHSSKYRVLSKLRPASVDPQTMFPHLFPCDIFPRMLSLLSFVLFSRSSFPNKGEILLFVCIKFSTKTRIFSKPFVSQTTTFTSMKSTLFLCLFFAAPLHAGMLNASNLIKNLLSTFRGETQNICWEENVFFQKIPIPPLKANTPKSPQHASAQETMNFY